LGLRYLSDKLSVVRSAIGVLRASRRGFASQLWDLLVCRFGRQKLSATEYADFGLYDARLATDARRAFLGRRLESALDRALNDEKWHCITQDKVITYMLLDSLGLPHPRIEAVFDPTPRNVGRAPHLRTAEELRGFLAGATFPLFGKPVGGAYGQGALSLLGFDRERDALLLKHGDPLPVGAFLDRQRSPSATGNPGYLFQELVKPHPSIVERCGDRLSTARVIVLLEGGEPRVLAALLRMPVGSSVVDNFVGGRTGNLVGHVDVEDGRVLRVVGGVAPDIKPVASHPDTKQSFDGFVVPGWKEVVGVAVRGAPAFPRLRFQHWDVAVSERGPLVLEVNIKGGLVILQWASGRGCFVPPLSDVAGLGRRRSLRRRPPR
jgi:hypothetical protein